MRGNPAYLRGDLPSTTSIPAYAGEPKISVSNKKSIRVYPRVCGGTPARVYPGPFSIGLSPRMRGNPGRVCDSLVGQRSIPAYAGEPVHEYLRRSQHQVYPRVCGGTGVACRSGGMARGLSPRMRGNRCCRLSYISAWGSIPAYAGEPRQRQIYLHQSEVYPRVCGGTEPCLLFAHVACGLSPRMRGNRPIRILSNIRLRSIPAYAGEPWPGISATWTTEVYPRVCGGTFSHPCSLYHAFGLSPRMRGNPGQCHRRPIPHRSIPAYAGEPPGQGAQPASPGVYPRVCGGT